jgi:hypothetical protein
MSMIYVLSSPYHHFMVGQSPVLVAIFTFLFKTLGQTEYDSDLLTWHRNNNWMV